jgi:hypothetical protein
VAEVLLGQMAQQRPMGAPVAMAANMMCRTGRVVAAEPGCKVPAHAGRPDQRYPVAVDYTVVVVVAGHSAVVNTSQEPPVRRA